MVNIQKEEKIIKQNNNTKEDIANEFLDEQTQQIKNTTSTISEIIPKNINNNINQYQEVNQDILGQSINTANRYQQETINTMQSIFNNYLELQKNITNTFQSIFTRFVNDTSNNKSYWNNFQFPQEYTDTSNKTNQNITGNTIKCIQRVYDFALTYTENFNKSIEIAQRYYNESVQNYYNFVNKIGRYYSNHN